MRQFSRATPSAMGALASGFAGDATGIIAMRRTIAGVGTFDIAIPYPHTYVLTNVNTYAEYTVTARNEWHALAIVKSFA
jgi:hypothetical protein